MSAYLIATSRKVFDKNAHSIQKTAVAHYTNIKLINVKKFQLMSALIDKN